MQTDITIKLDLSEAQAKLQKRLEAENLTIENYIITLISQGIPKDAIEIVVIQSVNAYGYFRFVRIDESKIKPYRGLIGNYLREPFEIGDNFYGIKNNLP